MATDKKRFLVSRTYSIVTPESAEIGDFAESGFVFERTPMSLEDTVRELKDCLHLSSWPIRSARGLTGHEWASTESWIADYATGEDRTESVHVSNLQGGSVSPQTLYRLFVLADLIAR